MKAGPINFSIFLLFETGSFSILFFRLGLNKTDNAIKAVMNSKSNYSH